MVKPLKVMILEDVKTDQELVKLQILKYNPNSIFTIAKNRQWFLRKNRLVLCQILFWQIIISRILPAWMHWYT